MLCSISSFSQWHDAIWMYGQNDPVDPRYGTFYLDFNEMDPQLHVHNRDMNFDVTVATIGLDPYYSDKITEGYKSS